MVLALWGRKIELFLLQSNFLAVDVSSMWVSDPSWVYIVEWQRISQDYIISIYFISATFRLKE